MYDHTQDDKIQGLLDAADKHPDSVTIKSALRFLLAHNPWPDVEVQAILRARVDEVFDLFDHQDMESPSGATRRVYRKTLLQFARLLPVPALARTLSQLAPRVEDQASATDSSKGSAQSLSFSQHFELRLDASSLVLDLTGEPSPQERAIFLSHASSLLGEPDSPANSS